MTSKIGFSQAELYILVPPLNFPTKWTLRNVTILTCQCPRPPLALLRPVGQQEQFAVGIPRLLVRRPGRQSGGSHHRHEQLKGARVEAKTHLETTADARRRRHRGLVPAFGAARRSDQDVGTLVGVGVGMPLAADAAAHHLA